MAVKKWQAEAERQAKQREDRKKYDTKTRGMTAPYVAPKPKPKPEVKAVTKPKRRNTKY